MQKKRTFNLATAKNNTKICTCKKNIVLLRRFLCAETCVAYMREMNILCIETSTRICSAALCVDGIAIEQCICREEANHAQLLPVYIERLLRVAKEKGLSVHAVGLSEGPGSYTGLRIGTSMAKGLCYGLHVPLIPIPTLHLLAFAAQQILHPTSEISHVILCPMIDARRMEVYTLDLEGQARAVVVENEDSLYTGTEEVYYFGDGAAKCQTVLTKPNWHYLQDIVPEARYLGAMAEQKWADGYRGADVAYFEPFYLKDFIPAQSHVKGLK